MAREAERLESETAAGTSPELVEACDQSRQEGGLKRKRGTEENLVRGKRLKDDLQALREQQAATDKLIADKKKELDDIEVDNEEV
jgi:hypothetical protein